jgi:hypothetical protein
VIIKQIQHTPEGSSPVKNLEVVNVICSILLCLFSDFWLLPLSSSSNYPLLNSYHNLFTVNYKALMSLPQNYKLYLVHDKRCLVSHWPPAWYASENNLYRTPCGSRKKPIAGRSPTGRLSTADTKSHMPYCAHAAPIPCCAVALRSRFQNGMVGARHGQVFIKHGHTV